MTDDLNAVTDALLRASRALMGIAVRSVGEASEITLPQFRVLVILTTRGSQRLLSLAGALGVNPSAATRLCDRLERKGLVRRAQLVEDRRVVTVEVTDRGAAIVQNVSRRRRRALASVLAQLPAAVRSTLTDALDQFGEAAGEPPEPDWDVALAHMTGSSATTRATETHRAPDS